MAAILDYTSSFTLGMIFLSCSWIWYLQRRSRRQPLPPGPMGFPLIGNLFDVPTNLQWLTFDHWCKQYGSDIISLNVLGTRLVILNTRDVANDVFEKRSSIYSDRPEFPMIKDLMGWDWAVGLMAYGNKWREHRTLFHQKFRPAAVVEYRPYTIAAAHDLLARLLEYPDGLRGHLRHMAGRLIISTVYGLKVQRDNDPYIESAELAANSVNVAGTSGAFLVNVFPALMHLPEWFPGGGFKKQAREWRKLADNMLNLPFEAAMRDSNTVTKSRSPAVIDSCLEYFDLSRPDHERLVKGFLASAFLGGVDTIVVSLTSFLLLMLQYPEVQQKARKELHDVVGTGRLPGFNDEPFLPYITAVVKELFRHAPALPMGFSHMSTVDDVYRGYHIPAGSVIMANSWAILHDEDTYPDPLIFRPERFLKDGKLDPTTQDPIASFGYGRRICPGRFMAYSSVWIGVASILATFDITKAVDENGEVIEPEYGYTSGLVSAPLPFACSIKPCSNDAASLIRSAVAQID